MHSCFEYVSILVVFDFCHQLSKFDLFCLKCVLFLHVAKMSQPRRSQSTINPIHSSSMVSTGSETGSL